MKLSSGALQCAVAGVAFMGTATAAKKVGRSLQNDPQPILSYTPLTSVSDAGKMDQDFLEMEALLVSRDAESRQAAISIYTNGGASKPYATLTLSTPVDFTMSGEVVTGTIVTGTSFSGAGFVKGRLLEPVVAGSTQVVVEYDMSAEDVEACQVGGSPNPVLDGCFVAEGTIALGNPEETMSLSLDYSYDPISENKNLRTLQTLSTSTKENMYDCANCPYETYQKFFNYYSSFDYANQYLMAAFTDDATFFANGNADFSVYGEEAEGPIEAIRKGTIFLSTFMQVVQSMEKAVDECRAGCDYAGCGNGTDANSWDEAVAFYVGSVSVETDGNDGDFLYTHADKRCRNFGTCNEEDSALVNGDIMSYFEQGQRFLLTKQCDDAANLKSDIITKMTVPLIQGTLRFAHLQGSLGVDEARAEATGATYAASILPFIHACSPVDALIVYSNMRVGNTGTTSFEDVKAALERSYFCMGLSCNDIGGLLNSDGQYDVGTEPCMDSDLFSTGAWNQPTTGQETGAEETSMSSTFPNAMLATPSPTETQTEQNIAAVVTVSPSDAALEVETTNATQPSSNINETTEQSTSDVDCPPCTLMNDDADLVASKSNSVCTFLVSNLASTITEGCKCACFVDWEFKFCAKAEVSYTGSGELVGPCPVTMPEGESEAAAEEDAIEQEVEEQLNEQYPYEGSTVGTNTSYADSQQDDAYGEDEDTPSGPFVSDQDIVISAVEATSSAVSFVAPMTCASFILASSVALLVIS